MSSDDQQPTDRYETGRTYSSAEISRKVREAATVPGISLLQAGILAATQKYEREFAAENSSPTVAQLLNLAQSYDRATTPTHREDLAAEAADELTLAEAGTIRRAAKAVELGMPRIICRARATGDEPNEIAHRLGATPSYVRRVLRENPTLLAEAVKAHALAPGDARTRLITEMARHDHEADAARSRQANREHHNAPRPTNAERLADVAEHRAEQTDTTND